MELMEEATLNNLKRIDKISALLLLWQQSYRWI